MLIRDALRLERGAVVSFVGGGGKTSAMFRLAAELREAGWRVVTTTTTHLGQAQVLNAPSVLRLPELPLLESRLDEFGHCLVIGPAEDDGKVRGVSADVIAGLVSMRGIDAVLVEADGCRTRPFKAPAEHEPVVPQVTTHLVPMVGVEVIGQTLDTGCVHRPERVARLAGVAPGSPISIETVARVLVHPDGGAKHRPPGARLVPLVNKVDGNGAMANARALADRLLKETAVTRVVLGSMLSEKPVWEVRSRVAGIVLAAGLASRYGATKQLEPWMDATLVGRVTQVALDAALQRVVVVTGHDAERVGAAVASLPVQVALNPDFPAGLSTSMRRGLSALPEGYDAAVFLLADQPGVTPEVVKALVQAHRETLAPIAIPTHRGRRGNPVTVRPVSFRGAHSDQGRRGRSGSVRQVCPLPCVRGGRRTRDSRGHRHRGRPPAPAAITDATRRGATRPGWPMIDPRAHSSPFLAPSGPADRRP